MFDQQTLNQLSKAIAVRVLEQIRPLLESRPVARLLTYEQAAAYLGLTASALKQRKSSGQIPDYVYVRMGTTILFDIRELDRWIDELKKAG